VQCEERERTAAWLAPRMLNSAREDVRLKPGVMPRGKAADASLGHRFSDIPLLPAALQRGAISIPSVDGDTDMVDVPDSGGSGGPGPAPAVAPADSCAVPLSMSKVTSGSFQGGLTMDSYYPKRAGGGFWQHPDTAGPFDTGTRAGSNVQLFGTFPSPCEPGQYSLGQTVTYSRFRQNGVDPREGKTMDDVAKSGQNASSPPFRQDFLGGGYNVSMADPPSVNYGPGTNLELDRDFVTSLAGPGGTQSTNWSTSLRIANGAVTTNTIS
jgi:hypothetical protein